MSDMVDVFDRIAERVKKAETTGIKVCLCGPNDDCATACRETRFAWRWRERWWGETVWFRAAGFRAQVDDCDGDYSEWYVDFRGVRIASGYKYDGDHFRGGIACCEIVIRWHLRKLRRAARVAQGGQI